MTDLHTRLLAAVQQRMDVARAATPGPWRVHGGWVVAGIAYCLSIVDPTGMAVLRSSVEEADMAATSENLEFIEASLDPATVLRHCERDLRVLERHAIADFGGMDRRYCAYCREDRYGDPICWPCGDILDLAAAYGVDVDG